MNHGFRRKRHIESPSSQRRGVVHRKRSIAQASPPQYFNPNDGALTKRNRTTADAATSSIPHFGNTNNHGNSHEQSPAAPTSAGNQQLPAANPLVSPVQDSMAGRGWVITNPGTLAPLNVFEQRRRLILQQQQQQQWRRQQELLRQQMQQTLQQSPWLSSQAGSSSSLLASPQFGSPTVAENPLDLD